jgi:beta-phosphoglucomutase-like phosphatase (HAD superfamily)
MLKNILPRFGLEKLDAAALLGADFPRDYKPKAAVYLAVADAFNLQPGQCMMCAAHSDDLKAAADNGLRTAFIARPEEHPGVSETAPNVGRRYRGAINRRACSEVERLAHGSSEDLDSVSNAFGVPNE